MAQEERLTWSSVAGLFNTKGLYLLGYSWLCGMSLWITFFGGIIAYRVLRIHQFGALQHRTFPVYFSISVGLASALLVLWVYAHPNVLTQLGSPLVADVAQVYALVGVVWLQGVNQFVVGPMTSKTMFDRHKLEKAEGKEYNNSEVSDEMKTLNSRFGKLHGISSLANLGAVIALVFHGLWLGKAGL
ncbi:hypothetical protein HYDPIDRAFT_173309 [Hydnomerulius pinastri MD-312]|nr:hypothetical protein HYDPIDRAFT_173309 [Hydnomerulius pinastri MD-312]